MRDMLKLFNSLTRKIDDFKSIHPLQVGMYTCGPTVYQFAHIGNFRAYATADFLVRTLKYNGYEVNFVMNITDVGHLVSDADTGEDKLEKSAKKEGKSAWEVAEFYTDAFLRDYDALQLTKPTVLAKATDHIKEQIDLISRLEGQGYTYITSDGVYFDTARFKPYGKLSTLDQSNEGVARVGVNEEKKNPRDFALWKKTTSNSPFSGGEHDGSLPVKGGSGRVMEWKSPWGKGFPGWHIECSAMSMKYLGETFDIHTGGADHLSIHHTNEIAQSEAATHKKFVNYWVHTAFMMVNGQKMSKSLENTYRLYDLEKEKFDPLALRYLYLQTHYGQEMNFTFQALEASQNALNKLRQDVAGWDDASDDTEDRGLREGSVKDFEKRFLEAINDDLNMPKALAVMWEMVKSPNPEALKAKTLFKMDQVLGLDLEASTVEIKKAQGIIPGQIQALVDERQRLRKERSFNAADQIRAQIKKLGYDIEDTKKGIRVRKN